MRWLQGHPDPLFDPLMAHLRDKVRAEERFFLPQTWPTTRATTVRRAVFDVVTGATLAGFAGLLLVPTLLAGAWALDRLWPRRWPRRWQDYDQQPGWWIDVVQRRISPQGFADKSFDLDDDFSLLCYGADPVIELSHRRKGPQAALTSVCPPLFWFNAGPPPQALAVQELADNLAQRLQIRRAGSRYAQ
ncbi:hypothetical protein [Amphibiibacter pelophylacis]|uniref:Uncharacterized protein n=1 Tax=Amphibiibacter pelophylacis TaxID=1799477 RepID=A0ACC6P4T5_9BURK